jgi:YidC/Oxa1 family membrane protein insertase
MDTRRLLLFLIFALSTFMLWDSWVRYNHPQPVATAESAAAPSAVVTASGVAPAQSGAPSVNPGTAIAATPPAAVGQIVTVKTDNLIAEINTVGGDIRRLKFLKQFDAKDRTKPFVLFQQKEVHTYITQSGLLGGNLPNHNTVYTAAATDYQMPEGQDTLEVRLTAEAPSAKVTKVYTFKRDGYLINVGYEIENTGTAPITTSAYYQFLRDKTPPDGDMKFVPTYTGPAVYTEQEKFQKVKFEDIDKGKTAYPQNPDNGWVGMLQHYFVAAWLPEGKSKREFFTKQLDGGLYSAGVILPVAAIAPGQTGKISVPLYAGPAESSLDKVAPGLGLTVDYGWLTIIAAPLFWLLTFLHGWVQNWGIAIIILTVLIKLAFFPLSAASFRSMAKMKVVAPKLEKIKQQYGDDKEKLHKAMMELYQTEKINPVGGCLPMLIQIPVFIALYWAILSSVELRYAPFFGWITDLSAPDPFYVLPLIMGASMVLQSRLNPTPPDPIQAKVMQIMPVMFSVFFFFFPAGLVLYSLVNSLLSMLQQWYITRHLNPEKKGAANA